MYPLKGIVYAMKNLLLPREILIEKPESAAHCGCFLTFILVPISACIVDLNVVPTGV